MKYNFKEDIKINEDNLQEEWIKQPMLFWKYSKKAKELRAKAIKANEKTKLIKSELILKASKDGIEGIDRISDVKAEAWARTQQEYLQAKEEWENAELEAEIFDAAVYALVQKKTALENLVRLTLGDYYSYPKYEEASKELKTKVKKAIVSSSKLSEKEEDK